MDITMKIGTGAALCMGLLVSSFDARAEDPVPPVPVPAERKAAEPAAVEPKTATPAAEQRAADPKPAEGGTGAGVSGAGWSAEIAPSNSAGITLDDKQLATVRRITDYFNSLNDLKGAFVQTASDNKRMKGKFYLKRPGRFRFDYALPSKQIVISDGEYLAIQDLDLNHEDRIALDQTPFRLLLRKDVDLVRDARINEVQEGDDVIILGLQDKNAEIPSKIRLVFATEPQLEIREWVTTDAQGVDTRVEVTQLVKGEQIDVSLFKIEPVSLNKFHPQ
jgi:outer membrane lipoprotein-sorting protein